ncbi:hypothetical protein [Endozoicomonas lisbonensis]|uniref:Uncharacterized protein n=1 Tax=Endozoicomonas lisbonensis TaxID=3120522 RepID=A0ABV2SJF1_9GAMM
MNKSGNLSFSCAIVMAVFWAVSGSSLAAPPLPTEGATTKASTTKASTTESPDDALYRLCGQQEPETGDISLTTRMKSAAVEVLETLAKQKPNEVIHRCVVSVPLNGNLDQEIKRFNDARSWEKKYNTAFLLFGKGIRPQRTDAQKPCDWEAKEATGDALPSVWQNTFWIDKTIHLEPGQSLVAIPLNGSNSQLASNHYVNIQKRITRANRNSLITLSGAGNTITGLTNLYAFDQIKTFNVQKTHFEVIKAQFNPMALPVNPDTSIIDIFNNQFFQYEKSVVDIAIKVDEKEIASGRLSGDTLAGIHNNQFYSCQTPGIEKKMAPALKVSIDYQDLSATPQKVHALLLQNNDFLTDGNLPVSLNIASAADSTIKDNRLEATNSGQSFYGIVLTGITDVNRAALTTENASFVLHNNYLKGYRVSLSLNAKLSLHLKSNQLLGTFAAVELDRLQAFPVELSGDSNNQYLPGASACGNLDQGNTRGRIRFADGTSCQYNWTPTSAPTQTLIPTPTVQSYPTLSQVITELVSGGSTPTLSSDATVSLLKNTTTLLTRATSQLNRTPARIITSPTSSLPAGITETASSHFVSLQKTPDNSRSSVTVTPVRSIKSSVSVGNRAEKSSTPTSTVSLVKESRSSVWQTERKRTTTALPRITQSTRSDLTVSTTSSLTIPSANFTQKQQSRDDKSSFGTKEIIGVAAAGSAFLFFVATAMAVICYKKCHRSHSFSYDNIALDRVYQGDDGEL